MVTWHFQNALPYIPLAIITHWDKFAKKHTYCLYLFQCKKWACYLAQGLLGIFLFKHYTSNRVKNTNYFIIIINIQLEYIQFSKAALRSIGLRDSSTWSAHSLDLYTPKNNSNMLFLFYKIRSIKNCSVNEVGKYWKCIHYKQRKGKYSYEIKYPINFN